MIAASLLIFTVLQLQGPDARAQAVAWETQAPSSAELERAWADADPRGRRAMVEAAWLAKTPEAMEFLAGALEDPLFRGREPWSTGFLRIALENGEVPGSGMLERRAEDAARMMQELVGQGWRPAQGQLRAGLEVGGRVRETCLKALLAQPDESFAAQQLDTADWTAAQIYLWELHAAQFPGEARSPEKLAELARRALLDTWNYEERRYITDAMEAIAPLLPDGCLDEAWSQADSAQRSGFLVVLESAPSGVGWDALRGTALTTNIAVHDRARAVRRMFALDGERASDALLGLADGSTPDQVMQPALFGMRGFGNAHCADALEAVLPSLDTPTRGMALEVLILYGDERQRLLWQDLYNTLADTEKRAVLRGASWTGQDGIRTRLWEQVYGSDPQERGIAENILRESLKPDEMVSEARPYVEAIADVDLRMQELMRLARHDSDRVAAVLRTALKDPAIASHAEAPLLAGRLLDDEASLPMFRSWWEDPEATPERRYTAACALASEEESMHAFLREEFWNISLPYQIAAMGVMREHPTPANLVAARDWMGDSRMELPGRLYCATTLIDAFDKEPHAVHELLAAVREFRDTLALGIPVDRVCGAFLLGVYELDDPGIRLAVEQAVFRGKRGRAAGSDIIELRLQLRQAALGLGEIDVEEGLERVLAGLRAPFPVRAWNAEPQLRDVASAAAALDFESNRYAAFDRKRSLPLLEEALRASPGDWHPDLLWMLRQRWERSFPEAVPVISEIQHLIEPYGSLRLPPPPAPEAPAPLREADQNRFFARLEAAVMGADLDTAERLIAVGKVRFDGDRRLRQWQGWTQIARRDLDGAWDSFEYAHRLGGTLPYLHMEQTLGQAVIAELRDPGSTVFDDFMDYEEQAGTLLRARLPVEARPELAALLPPESEEEVR